MLIIALLTNFICINISRAGEEKPKSREEEVYTSPAPNSEGAAAGIIEEGQTTTETVDGKASGSTVTTNSSMGGASIVGVVMGVLALILDIPAFIIHFVMSTLTYATEEDPNYASDDNLRFMFTVNRAVFNRVPLFNINYFNTDETYQVGDTTIHASSSINAIKDNVRTMYIVCRLLALLLELLVLIYIGIRMAISTIAEEQAKYKKMFIGWLESLILLFLLQYIMIAVISFGEAITNVFYKLECSLLSSSGNQSFEDVIMDTIFTLLTNNAGLKLSMATIIYWFLLITHIKFLWMYLKRVLMVGFLIMISPLIVITYSIDKAGDGKAQAFSTWFREFTINVLIQPLHALIYLVFCFTAGKIATVVPLIALAFLMSMGAAEKMVKVIFNMKGLASLAEVNDLPFLKKGR